MQNKTLSKDKALPTLSVCSFRVDRQRNASQVSCGGRWWNAGLLNELSVCFFYFSSLVVAPAAGSGCSREAPMVHVLVHLLNFAYNLNHSFRTSHFPSLHHDVVLRDPNNAAQQL